MWFFSSRDQTTFNQAANWSQIQTAVKTYSWRAIYAKNDGDVNYHLNQMIKDCNAYGYADCVAWCEEQAALCWAAQQAQAALVK